MKPQRIQLSRRKGWRMPANTVVVARPSKWGNPFAVGKTYPYNPILPSTPFENSGPTTIRDAAHAVECFKAGIERFPEMREMAARARSALRGRNVACWCPLDQPCHGNILLELANR